VTQHELRTNLDYYAALGRIQETELERLFAAWESLKSDTADSYQKVIEDRLKAIKRTVYT